MTIEQYTYELFRLYKSRQFMIELIVEHGPEHDFYLDGAAGTAADELKKIDQQIFDLVHKVYTDENDSFSDFQYDLAVAMGKVLEMLKANT